MGRVLAEALEMDGWCLCAGEDLALEVGELLFDDGPRLEVP